MSRVHILGVSIDPVTQGQAIERIHAMLATRAQHHVTTPNSEMLVAASTNTHFRSILNRSHLALPDGAGLLWAARWTHQTLPERVTGVDTVERLCAELTEEHPVFLLGAAPGVAERAANILRERNPHLRITGTYAGSPRDEDAHDIVRRIQESGAHVLFVAFGAPAQDIWIWRHLATMPSVRVAMGVGGTFDFIAGVQKRAPQIFRTLHVEWLWRLMREPRRIGRIGKAVVVFPLLVLKNRKG